MYRTMKQIEKEYDGFWVYLTNCAKDEHHSVIGGEVALHGKSMNEVLRGMAGYDKKGNSVYVRYIGELPEGVAGLL